MIWPMFSGNIGSWQGYCLLNSGLRFQAIKKIKKHFTFLIILAVGFFVFSHAEKKAVLEEIKKPRNIAIDDSQFYITEDATAFIYSLADFKLKKKFGSKGQGPRDFETLPHIPIGIDASTDKLIVGSIRKISYWWRMKKTSNGNCTCRR